MKVPCLALQMYSYRIKKYIGAYCAAMGGMDIIVFTGGIGENDTFTRESVCSNMEFLGIQARQGKKQHHKGKEAIISQPEFNGNGHGDPDK
jgi:acetate kinase